MGIDVVFSDRGILIRLSGRFDKGTLAAMTVAAWHHPQWDEARYVVIDQREVTEVCLTEAETQVQAALANAGSLSSRKTRTAAVVRHPELRRLSEIFAARVRRDVFEFEIFEEIDAALAWASAAPARDTIARRAFG